ncbi:MAG: Trypsin, partial [Pseudomonadota bacterium]
LTPLSTKPQKSLVIKSGELVYVPELNALIPLIRIQTKHGYRLCTGVFLAPNKVLTAAHCVMKIHDKMAERYFESKDLYLPEKISIIFPKNLLKPLNYKTDKPSRWRDYHVKAVYVKSDVFAGAHIENGVFSITDFERIHDIALIELSSAPKYKFHMELTSVAPEINAEQTIVGFGDNNGNNAKAIDQNHGDSGLLRAGKTIVSDSTLLDHPSVLRIGGSVTNGEPYVVACKADSGGPSLVYNESTLSYTVTGIASLGYGLNSCSFLPNIYMSVAYYKNWIEAGYMTDSLKVRKFPKM